MGERATLSLRNDLAELERLSQFIAEFGEREGWPEKAIFEMQLALDEVVTNVISYAYSDGGIHELRVTLTSSDGEVVARVEDDGRPFDPLDAPQPTIDAPLEERPIGGLGWHLVRKVTNELAYRREGDKNVLTLKKQISGQSG
jgi:anti-sigma regulatory factor (Ser/Thr protein kinase)